MITLCLFAYKQVYCVRRMQKTSRGIQKKETANFLYRWKFGQRQYAINQNCMFASCRNDWSEPFCPRSATAIHSVDSLYQWTIF